MEKKIPDRAAALEVLRKYVKSDALLKHAYAVEGVMRYMARKRGEDEEKWGIVGLVHDLDYELHPNEHCVKTREFLEKEGWPEEYIRAAVSHGWGLCCDEEPQTVLEKALYAIDELTGLVAANAMVRPSKSVLDMDVKSLKKKWKSPAFAAGVNREVVQKGADRLGVPLEELMEDAIMGMREVAEQVGLKGSL
jgi:predicted hydrolase (HD superfamily)